ncbi:MAG: hypothetical protein ACKVY0_16215 [Prosthecobacter sp.]|uniref:hypothetical protein n=1 Tax=Prosthecobacter sp. TaxID=1965333 RepID=UPI003900D36C
MNQHSVFCIAYSRLQADQMVQRLKGAAFSIQDISVLAAVGPMVAALGDMADGLHNQGVPLPKARLYQVRVNEGRILLSVQAASDDEITLAKEILSKAGGNDICATCEPAPQRRLALAPLHARRSEARLSFA